MIFFEIIDKIQNIIILMFFFKTSIFFISYISFILHQCQNYFTQYFHEKFQLNHQKKLKLPDFLNSSHIPKSAKPKQKKRITPNNPHPQSPIYHRYEKHRPKIQHGSHIPVHLTGGRSAQTLIYCGFIWFDCIIRRRYIPAVAPHRVI